MHMLNSSGYTEKKSKKHSKFCMQTEKMNLENIACISRRKETK